MSTIRQLQPRLFYADTCRGRSSPASECAPKFRMRVVAAGFGGAGKGNGGGSKGFGNKTGGKQEPGNWFGRCEQARNECGHDVIIIHDAGMNSRRKK